AGATTGAVAGALVLTYLPEYLQQLTYWQSFAYGLLLALVMFVLPHGIYGTAAEILARIRKPSRAIDPAQGLPSEDILKYMRASDRAELVAKNLTVQFGGLTALNE